MLLGAEEGLFILPVGKPGQDNRPRQIPGVRNVYQIKIEKHLGLALLISGTFPLINCGRLRHCVSEPPRDYYNHRDYK